MDYARADWVNADAEQIGVAGQEAVHEGAGGLPCPWVHHEAGGLVDHQEVIVLVHHRHDDVGLGHEPPRLGRIGDVDLDGVARPEAGRA